MNQRHSAEASSSKAKRNGKDRQTESIPSKTMSNEPGTGRGTIPNKPSDTSEHDAVNVRFVERREPERAFCLSCRSEFTFSLLNDIIQHYLDRRHEPCCRCLYCDGPMYRYRDGKGQLQYYHDCQRWRRHLDRAP
uniref:LIM zinc-binding domain-containing protein n=1 Tax=Anopheles quadriannulatus TaxID=34691 RepID=A0A182XDZ4_ANOQN